MMNKKRTSEIGRTKYLVFLPLAALLLIISNIEAIARNTERMVTEVFTPEPIVNTIEPVAPEPIEEMVISAPAATQQEKKFDYKGKVVDQNGKPIEGAEIYAADEKTASPASKPVAVTNKNGEFSFQWGERVVYGIHARVGGESGGTMLSSNKDDKERLNKVVTVNLKPTITSPDIPGDVVFEVVEVMPEFPGGQQGLLDFLIRNILYPETAKAQRTQGRVIVQFIVEPDGSITNTAVLRSVDAALDREALRVISTMPKWSPGKQRGVAVRTKYTVPVTFRLDTPVKEISDVVVVAYARDDNDEEPIFEIVEQMPQYPGGQEALMQFIGKNMRYPSQAQIDKEQGRVIVQFVVNKQGKPTHPRILRSVSPSLDAEAIRIVSEMPDWKPGTQRGEAVNVKYTVPVTFRLQ